MSDNELTAAEIVAEGRSREAQIVLLGRIVEELQAIRAAIEALTP
jgi:hypothetical protein